MKPGLCAVIWFIACFFAVAQTNTATLTNSSRIATNTTVASTNAVRRTAVISPGQLEIAKAFYVERGFRLELVAGESLVSEPVAMTFDENDRLFVLEAGKASEGSLGRIRLLSGADTNGVYHTNTLYATNVYNPTSILCYGGGVFVGAGGQILYLKDTTSDGVADVRREVFKSFGETTNGTSGDVTITGLAWGLDNRIHAATAGTGGDVISSSSPIQSIILSNGNFAFDPRSFVLTSESGSDPSGMAFDNTGHTFVSSPGKHLQAVMYPANAARNPWFEMPPPVENLAGTGPDSFIYPPDRKNLVAFYPDGATAMRFSAATSLVIYRGSAFPPDFSGDAFEIDTGGNVIHRDKLKSDGVGWMASRPDTELDREFFAVKDESFQLRCIANAPDGTLYVAGTARAKLSAGKAGKTNSLAAGGPAPGRIYRIVPLNFKQPRAPQLGKATTDLLVLNLRHPNGWQRDTAARLLFERQDRTAIVPLIRLLFDMTVPPLARMHALRALDGLQVTADGRAGKALMEPHTAKALSDPYEGVREQGVLTAARFIAPSGLIPEKLWDQLAPLAADPSPRVRYQFALFLAQIHQTERVQTLAQIIRTDVKSRWLQAAVLSGLNEGAAEMFSVLVSDANFRNDPNGQEFLKSVLGIVGQENRRAEVNQVLNSLRNVPEPQVAFTLALALENSLQRANESLTTADAGGVFTALYIRAENLVLDMNTADSARIAALRLLCSVTNVDARLSGGLVNEWPSLRPQVRSEVMMYYLSRYTHMTALVSSLQAGYIPTTELTPLQIRFLFDYDDKPVHESTVAVYGKEPTASRAAVVNEYQTALRLPGSAERGRRIYEARCAACHQLAGQGKLIGVSLDAASHLSKEVLLIKTLDPNREANPAHPEVVIETSDRQAVMGFIAREDTRSTTLIDPNGVERTVGRANNMVQNSLGLSGMPSGLQAGLSQQDMADLLEFITTNGAQ